MSPMDHMWEDNVLVIYLSAMPSHTKQKPITVTNSVVSVSLIIIFTTRLALAQPVEGLARLFGKRGANY